MWTSVAILMPTRSNRILSVGDAAISKSEKLSVGLPTGLANKVRAAVEAGEHASTGEIIREAIHEWAEQRGRRAATLAELRAAVQVGVDSGPPQPRRLVDEALADYRDDANDLI